MRTEQSSTTGDDPPARLSYVIARVERVLRRRLEEAIEPYGLTLTQYMTLSMVRDRRGLSNAQLARRSFVTPQSMNDVVCTLERRGLIRREVDPAHRRISRAELTESGRDTLIACDKATSEVEDRMLTGLAPDERDRFMVALLGCVRELGGGLRTI